MTASADQSRRWVLFATLLFILGVGWTAADIVLDRVPKLRHRAILDSAYFAFALWVGAVVLMLRAPGHGMGWSSESRAGGAVVLVLGAVMFWIHVAVSFHFAHRWSHANAVHHVQETSGFGPGIFVSYFFTLLWAVDAAWWVANPTGYAGRAKWVGMVIHGFMAFIALNGTVVFGHTPMREVSAGVFVVLGAVLAIRLAGRKSPA